MYNGGEVWFFKPKDLDLIYANVAGPLSVNSSDIDSPLCILRMLSAKRGLTSILSSLPPACSTLLRWQIVFVTCSSCVREGPARCYSTPYNELLDRHAL